MDDAVHLTEREKEVAELVAKGRRRKHICADLGIARGTVDAHIHNIAEKLPGAGPPNVKITRFYYLCLAPSSTEQSAA